MTGNMCGPLRGKAPWNDPDTIVLVDGREGRFFHGALTFEGDHCIRVVFSPEIVRVTILGSEGICIGLGFSLLATSS